MVRHRDPSAGAVLSARTSEERALLYEAALREMEQHRDDLILACTTLRRLMESERKIAARERGESPASAGAIDPSVSATGATDPGTPSTRD